MRALVTAVLAVLSLVCFLACSKKEDTREAPRQSASQPAAASPASEAGNPWEIDLKVSPPRPSMSKEMAFIVHITDEKGKPVTDADVNGALTMKVMDMGLTQVKFKSRGDGDYEGSLKGLDMSGPWNMAVDASRGNVHARKNFDVTIYD